MKRVLLIDDDETSNFLTSKTIEFTGLGEIQKICLNGKEGVEYLKELNSENPKMLPEIILLDLNMPEMDGWTFLDNIQHEGLNIPVYILSSSNREVEIEKSKSAFQVKRFLVKPLRKEDISIILMS